MGHTIIIIYLYYNAHIKKKSDRFPESHDVIGLKVYTVPAILGINSHFSVRYVEAIFQTTEKRDIKVTSLEI